MLAVLLIAATSLELIVAGDYQAAAEQLEREAASDPENALLYRDLAISYAHLARPEEALAKIDRAIELGDTDPEAQLLRAMLLDITGRRPDAIRAAQEIRTAEGDLLGASMRDPASVHKAAELAEEDSARAALAALVLAADAGERGLEGVARLLTETASQRAAAARSPLIQNAARELERRLDEHGRVIMGGRLRSTIDHATNPLYLERPDETALRLALTGEATLSTPIGIARFDAAVRADQHFILTQRSVFRELDLTLLGAAIGVELPISSRPSAALLGLRARASDAFGDRLNLHFATAFEGGPYLVLPLGSALALEMGFYGIAVDFIDLSPSDQKISSQNRDRVGQRAIFALAFAFERVDGRIEASFLRDDALGDAFDALGGFVSGRLRAYPGGGVVLQTGITLAAREFGPVGDSAIIGPASTRTELRSAVELGAAIPVTENVALIIEDVWLRNSARRGHRYTENVLSVGAEVSW